MSPKVKQQLDTILNSNFESVPSSVRFSTEEEAYEFFSTLGFITDEQFEYYKEYKAKYFSVFLHTLSFTDKNYVDFYFSDKSVRRWSVQKNTCIYFYIQDELIEPILIFSPHSPVSVSLTFEDSKTLGNLHPCCFLSKRISLENIKHDSPKLLE